MDAKRLCKISFKVVMGLFMLSNLIGLMFLDNLVQSNAGAYQMGLITTFVNVLLSYLILLFIITHYDMIDAELPFYRWIWLGASSCTQYVFAVSIFLSFIPDIIALSNLDGVLYFTVIMSLLTMVYFIVLSICVMISYRRVMTIIL